MHNFTYKWRYAYFILFSYFVCNDNKICWCSLLIGWLSDISLRINVYFLHLLYIYIFFCGGRGIPLLPKLEYKLLLSSSFIYLFKIFFYFFGGGHSPYTKKLKIKPWLMYLRCITPSRLKFIYNSFFGQEYQLPHPRAFETTPGLYYYQ